VVPISHPKKLCDSRPIAFDIHEHDPESKSCILDISFKSQQKREQGAVTSATALAE
jgi:hypothetical protein